MSERLALEEGLFVGMSSGAAVWAALQVAADLSPGDTVVTLLPDRGTGTCRPASSARSAPSVLPDADPLLFVPNGGIDS